MSDEDAVLPLQPDKNQRTLFSLAKVVRLDSTSMCFTIEEILSMKEKLLDATQTMHELLIILRKLDCYKLQVADLERTQIGNAVATLAKYHPRPNVVRLACSLLTKWRALVENSLFQDLAYDVKAAEAADEGEAVAPEDLINAEKEQQRLEKLERRRQRIEEDFMAVSSSDEDMSDPETDPEWAPVPRKSQSQSNSQNSLSQRRSRSGRQAHALRAAAAANAAAAAAAAAAGEGESDFVGDKEMKKAEEEVVVVIDCSNAKEEKKEAGAEAVEEQKKEGQSSDSAGEAAPEAAAPNNPPEPVKKARPTILEMLQRQAQMQKA